MAALPLHKLMQTLEEVWENLKVTYVSRRLRLIRFAYIPLALAAGHVSTCVILYSSVEFRWIILVRLKLWVNAQRANAFQVLIARTYHANSRLRCKTMSLNKETTVFNLQNMFRHSHVIFSCKWALTVVHLNFILKYGTKLRFRTYVYNLNMKYAGNKNSARIVTLSDLGTHTHTHTHTHKYFQ